LGVGVALPWHASDCCEADLCTELFSDANEDMESVGEPNMDAVAESDAVCNSNPNRVADAVLITNPDCIIDPNAFSNHDTELNCVTNADGIALGLKYIHRESVTHENALADKLSVGVTNAYFYRISAAGSNR
jgi:hypothetical protein